MVAVMLEMVATAAGFEPAAGEVSLLSSTTQSSSASTFAPYPALGSTDLLGSRSRRTKSNCSTAEVKS